MLRDRCPKLVNYALKYCNAKEKWLDHVYYNWIWMFVSNQERYDATKAILGIKNNKMSFAFDDTILWDNLSDEETMYWKIISGWVSWFQTKYPYIENEYNLYKDKIDIITMKQNIMLNWLTSMCPTSEDDEETKKMKNKEINRLVDYLIECFDNS